MEALATARDALTAAQARQAFYSDRGRVELNVGVGDQVLVHREFLVTPEARARPCHKLSPKWFGPFKVVERISANAFRLDLPHTLHCHPVFNVTALKKYFPSDMEGRNVPPPAPIIDLDGNERFIVEEVLDHRRKRMGLQYLVRWKGYPDAAWKPAAFLQDEDGHDIIQLQSYKSKHFR